MVPLLALFAALTSPAAAADIEPLDYQRARGQDAAYAAAVLPGPMDSQQTRRVFELFEKSQGSFDLVRTARLLFNAAGQSFVWTTGSDGELTKVSTPLSLFKARRMACYEFVRYVAYMAGNQEVGLQFDDVPDEVFEDNMEVTPDELAAMGYSARPSVMISAAEFDLIKGTPREWSRWDDATLPTPGSIVEGVAVYGNNNAGFFHVGIALEDGLIMSLRGEKNLVIEPIREVFGGYPTVRWGPYDWEKAL